MEKKTFRFNSNRKQTKQNNIFCTISNGNKIKFLISFAYYSNLCCCDASRVSTGVQFRDSVAAFFKTADSHPESSPIRSKSHPKKKRKSFQDSPKACLTPSKIDQNRCHRPLGAHLGFMLTLVENKTDLQHPKKLPKSAQK